MTLPSFEITGNDVSARGTSSAWPINEDAPAPIVPQGKAQNRPPLDIQYQQLYNKLVLNAQSGGSK